MLWLTANQRGKPCQEQLLGQAELRSGCHCRPWATTNKLPHFGALPLYISLSKTPQQVEIQPQSILI